MDHAPLRGHKGTSPGACKHRSDGVESLAFGRTRGAADIYGFIQTPSTTGRSPQTLRDNRCEASSCRTLLGVPLEIIAVDPHTMEDDGEFSGDRNGGFTVTFGFHQLDAPGFER